METYVLAHSNEQDQQRFNGAGVVFARHHHNRPLDHPSRKRHHERHRLHLRDRAIKDNGKAGMTDTVEINVPQAAQLNSVPVL